MIKFGTSGWRDIIAGGFTYDKVKIVSQAIADYLKFIEKKEKGHIIIGYDTRFMSDDFAKCSAEILIGNGFEIHFNKEDVPTPVIAYEIIRSKALGGINITASHNPYNYNGLKFSPSWGGPALPETTKKIEKFCQEILDDKSRIKSINFDEGVKSDLIKILDFRDNYFSRIYELIDIETIKKSNLKIAIDVMHGAGRNYLDKFLLDNGVNVKVLHTNRDPYFDGHHPEPTSDFLGEVINLVKKEECDIAIATDGDADRFGIIDRCGEYITANDFIPVLLYHLLKNRNYKGIAARSIMTSSFLDAVAKKFGAEIRETPVGFKYIGDILVKENLIVGGEESGGLTIHSHVPEKDGIIACLLAIEIVAKFGKSIREIIIDLQKEVGTFYNKRNNYRLSVEKMNLLKEKLKNNLPNKFGDMIVKNVITLDGYKFLFDNDSWFGIRFSGTEPIVRCYVESKDKNVLKKLLKEGEKLINF